jgi:hypothetical protein
MQNYCNLNSEVIAITHVVPDPAEFTECLKYLDLSRHFKNKPKYYNVVDEVQQAVGEQSGQILSNTLTTQEEQKLKKLKKEKADLVITLENLKKQYRSTFVNIGNIIGADEDLENLIHKPNAKFWLEFKKKNGILVKISALDSTITKKEETIIALEK